MHIISLVSLLSLWVNFVQNIFHKAGDMKHSRCTNADNTFIENTINRRTTKSRCSEFCKLLLKKHLNALFKT